MDRAALQRVTLVPTSGTLCWTVWSAREQQSLRTWIVSLFLGSAVNQLARGNAFLCDVETYPIASISTSATTRC